MEICKVYDESFKNGDKLVVFTKEGCPYCEEAKKKLMTIQIPDELVENLPKEIVDISIDECNNFADEFDIKVVPTFVRLVNGKEYGRAEGYDEEGIRWIITMKIDEEVLEDEEEGEFVEEESSNNK